MSRRLVAVVAVAATLACSACRGPYQWFRPQVGVTGEAPDGTPAGEYDLWHDGARVGEVRLWSTGGEPRGEGASLHVGIELENLSGRPLILDAEVRIVDVSTESVDDIPVLTPSHAVGPTRAEPLARAHRELWFDLPDASPWSLTGFTVEWRVRDAGGAELSGTTRFVPDLYARLWNAIQLAMDDAGDGD